MHNPPGIDIPFFGHHGLAGIAYQVPLAFKKFQGHLSLLVKQLLFLHLRPEWVKRF
jgi:hypothetical protein